MIPFSSRLSRYLAIQMLAGLALSFGVIVTIILLVDFVEQTRAIGTRVDIPATDLFMLTLMRAPLLIEQTLPFIFLFGILTALFRLNRRSELIVMRASGYSAWRIVAPAVWMSLIGGLLGAMALNPIGSALNARYEAQEAALTRSGNSNRVESNPIWLRELTEDGYVIIAAADVDGDAGSVTRPRFLYYRQVDGGRPVFDRRIDADRAVLRGGFWGLENAIESTPGQEAEAMDALSLPTAIERQALFERSRSPRTIAFWDLPGVILAAREAGLTTHRFELRWQTLLALPLTLIAVSLLAAAATLRLYRLGGAASFALAGGAAGFLVYFVQELLASFGSSAALPPITAAWAAPTITALLALAYLASTEDG
ncbi:MULTISPECIES: LptF/LptG family permease [Hyphobacterium]|uniref:LptF/LptG family permease n=1 Tax=Hyphobacterium vulgare TaxID=1736751 RepID=A0ABV7A182_9PROT